MIIQLVSPGNLWGSPRRDGLSETVRAAGSR